MYQLTNSFPYLMNRLGVRLGELFTRRLVPYGITLQMYRVMAALWETSNQRLGDLADTTSIEISTLSRMVTALRRKGLVSSARPDDNGRTVSIALTPKGRGMVEELIPHAQYFESIAIRAFGTEVEWLKDCLREAYANLDAIDEALKEEERKRPPGGERKSV